jgi:RNA polymerase sigma-70 factor, ECF subfamily
VDDTTEPRTAVDHDAGDEQLRRLVLRALDGDRAAAAELYTRFHPTVLALHLANTRGDRQLAHDLTQDTFVKVLYRLDRFEWRGPASLRAWIATIARNTFRDHVRAAPQRHHGGYDLPDAPDTDEARDPEAVAERDLAASRDEAGRVLEQLKPEHRLVLTRMLGDGAPAADVARELGRSEAAIHQLKRRALEAARRTADRQLAMDRGP